MLSRFVGCCREIGTEISDDSQEFRENFCTPYSSKRLQKLGCRKRLIISQNFYRISGHFYENQPFVKSSKSRMPIFRAFSGVQRGIFPFVSAYGSPDRPTERVRNFLFQFCGMCRAILPMCGNETDVRERIRHEESVSPMLVTTAVLCATKSRQSLAAILA